MPFFLSLEQVYIMVIFFGRLITASALLLLCSTATFANAQTHYYVSASSGKDRNNGTSEEKPWKSLARVAQAKLSPGDTVHFKSGDVFNGQLVIDESGSDKAPIHFTAYGNGELPIIDGAKSKGGSEMAAILIENQDHIELSRLEVRNFRKRPMENRADVNAYGIWVKNTGQRVLSGFEFHHLVVGEVYPIRAKKSFNDTSVTGIRFETLPAKSKKRAVNTRDIYIHDNLIRHTARFGIALRHRPSKIEGITGTALDYDENVRIINNRCEDLGGSCVLMNGVWHGLLEGNKFIRSGAMVEPKLSVNRGSGAWFFRSNHVVAQHNVSIGSRGHNDSAGMHVDFNNENILVQYNFSYDNEGYGTEILGKNRNVIWRHNISVADGTRRAYVERPEGGKSEHPGKTVFVSDFAVPKRMQSRDVFIYNNTYIVTSNSNPLVELNGESVHLWNNLFVVQDGSLLGRKVILGWRKGPALDMQGNRFVGDVSPNFIALDKDPSTAPLKITGELSDVNTFAFSLSEIMASEPDAAFKHPSFPAAGKGIFSHISETPHVDYFGNSLNFLRQNDETIVGAGYSDNKK